MAYFAPHDAILRYLEAMTGRRDVQQFFDALVLQGVIRPWAGVEGFWGMEARTPEEWRTLTDSIDPS